MADDLRAFFDSLPKAELHVHLRGAMPPEVFAALTAKYAELDLTTVARPGLVERWRGRAHLAPWLRPGARTVEQVRELFRFDDFASFILTYALTGFYFREVDDFRQLVDGVLSGLARQNIVYAEVTVSVREYLNQGIALADLLAVLDEAAARAATRVRWIMDVVRDFGPEAGLELVGRVTDIGCASLVGITIGGSEHACPPAPFEPVFTAARRAGLRLTAHAGEALGPESVRDAVEILGVARIGHGVRAIEDPALVETLAARGIPLEICPTSNLCTAIYPSYARHPLFALHQAGVPVTVNTDDPTFFGTTLTDELLRLHTAAVPLSELRTMLTNAYRYAFDPSAAELLPAFESAWEELDPPPAGA